MELLFSSVLPISAVVAQGEANRGTESSSIQRWTSGLHYKEPKLGGTETSYGGSTE